jgi:RimJ/RimL family protein N-acetyltransferase
MNIKIREVTIADAQLLFGWANDVGTRKSSFNSDPIEWNDHLAWLNNKLSDLSCTMFIFLQNNKAVGLVRIETDENSVISVTVAPDQRGKGLGTEMLKMSCYRFWQQSDRPVLVYIKEDNMVSLRAAEKAGFKYLRNGFCNQIPCFILMAEKNAD